MSVTSNRASAIRGAVEALRTRLDELGGSRIEILAVAKGFPWSDVQAAMDAGIRAVGENYAQEILDKYGHIPVDERPEIHFIGRLQTNKVARLAPVVSTWQTVDRHRLAETIARHAPGARIMVQVNTSGEDAKGGCPPNEVQDLVDFSRANGLRVDGLMVIGPTSADEEETRRAFAAASSLRTDLGLDELSMGMSGDLDLAVRYGSTMVRVGSALFGLRPPKI